MRKLIDIVKTEQYSRIPVYNESIDNIIGVLYVKDLLPLIVEEAEDDFELISLH